MTAPFVPTPPALAELPPDLRVWHRSYLTGLATEIPVLTAEFNDKANDAGTGSFTTAYGPLGSEVVAALYTGDADTFIFTYGQTATAAFEMLPETIEDTVVEVGEESVMGVSYAGRGVLVELDDARIYPALGLKPDGQARKPVSTDRWFNWATPDLDRGTWTTPVIQTVAALPAQIEGYNSRGPEGLPWPYSTYWIWMEPRAQVSGVPHSTGDCYFHVDLAIRTDVPFDDLWIYTAGDDTYEVWLDGVFLHAESVFGRNDNWERCTRVKVEVTPGATHSLDIKVTNIAASAEALADLLAAGYTPPIWANPGRLIVSVVPGNPGWTTPKYRYPTPVFRSGVNDAIGLGFPSSPPNVPLGKILIKLLTEAQTRGCLTGWTWDFSELSDSNGNLWPQTREESFRIGDGYYTGLLKKLGETWIEFANDPSVSRRLQCFLRDGATGPSGVSPGRNAVSTSVVLSPGSNLGSYKSSVKREVKNVLLYRFDKGLGQTDPTETAAAASIAAHGRREGYLDVNNVKDQAAAETSVRASRSASLEPIREAVASHLIVPGATGTPYETGGYRIGDYVSAPAPGGGFEPHRVAAIALKRGPSSDRATVVPQLLTPQQTQVERIERWLRTLGDGTIQGRSEISAQPSPSVIESKQMSRITLTPFSGNDAEMQVGWRGTPYISKTAQLMMSVGIHCDPDLDHGGLVTTIWELQKNGSAVCTMSLAPGQTDNEVWIYDNGAPFATPWLPYPFTHAEPMWDYPASLLDPFQAHGDPTPMAGMLAAEDWLNVEVIQVGIHQGITVEVSVVTAD